MEWYLVDWGLWHNVCVCVCICLLLLYLIAFVTSFATGSLTFFHPLWKENMDYVVAWQVARFAMYTIPWKLKDDSEMIADPKTTGSSKGATWHLEVEFACVN